MDELNELLRSAYQISMREGANTNWVAFSNNLRKALLAAHGNTTDFASQQQVLRATCTAKTYQLPQRVARTDA